jgi:tetratricopeptide (TPR) repeat protein
MEEIAVVQEKNEEIRSEVQKNIENARDSIKYFEYDEALKMLETASSALYKLDGEQEKNKLELEIIYLRATIEWLLGRWEEALTYLNNIIEKKDTASHKKLLIHAFIYKGEILGARGHYTDAVDLLKEGLSIADSLGDLTETAHCCQLLGTFYSRIGESVTGKKLIERSQRIAEANPGEPGMKRVLASNNNQMGLAHFRNRHLDDAQVSFNKSLEMLEDEPFTMERAEALRYMGITESARREYRTAMEYHYQALWIYKQLKYRLGQAKVYNSIGQTCADLSKLDVAIHYLEKAEAICRELAADAEAASIYGKLGNVYMLREEYDKAKSLFTKDIELSKKFDNTRAMAFAYRNIGECNIYLGNNNDAIENLRHSAELFKKIGDPVNEKKIMLNLCAAYINDGNLEESEKAADQLNELIPAREKSQDAANLIMLQGIIERYRKNWAQSSKLFNDSIDMMKALGKSHKLSEAYYEYGLMCLGIHDKEGALSKFREAFKIARELGLPRQKDRYFKIIERIEELEIIKLLIDEIE